MLQWLQVENGRTYGSIFRVWFGWQPFVDINGPTEIGQILGSQEHIGKVNVKCRLTRVPTRQ